MGPLGIVVDALLHNLKQGLKKKRSDLQTLWPQIAGPQFTPHTRPVLLGKETLCIWVDDSVLAYELSRRYPGTFLKRADAILGEGAIKKIIFRVGQIRQE